MEKVLGVILGIAIVAGLLYGGVFLVTLMANYVLAYFGAKPVTMLLVFCVMTLLSLIGGYFRSHVQVKQ